MNTILENANICEYCLKTFKSSRGVKTHYPSCKERERKRMDILFEKQILAQSQDVNTNHTVIRIQGGDWDGQDLVVGGVMTGGEGAGARGATRGGRETCGGGAMAEDGAARTGGVTTGGGGTGGGGAAAEGGGQTDVGGAPARGERPTVEGGTRG